MLKILRAYYLVSLFCKNIVSNPLRASHIIEREILMANRLPIKGTGKWTFHLQQAQSLQFHIGSERDADTYIVIEGHDISSLLDYLYENRELIYEATHDQEARRLEAMEARNAKFAARSEERHIERIFYIDDGEGRTRTNTAP